MHIKTLNLQVWRRLDGLDGFKGRTLSQKTFTYFIKFDFVEPMAMTPRRSSDLYCL